MLVPRTEHQGTRPDWNCQVCGEPWPCATAKVELGEQYQRFPLGLSVLLGSYLADAIDDWTTATSGPPPDLYERFLGWSEEPGGRGMTHGEPLKRPTGLLSLLLDAFDASPVVRVGTTLVRVHWIHMREGRAVIELEAGDMAVAVEQLVLDSVTAAKARAARSEAEQPTRT